MIPTTNTSPEPDETPHGGLRAILQRTLLSDESGQMVRPIAGERLDPNFTVVPSAPRVVDRRNRRRRAD